MQSFEDESLNVIQCFYEHLSDLQKKNTDYTKNMMQILHIKRERLSETKPNLFNEEINSIQKS